ncbi:hypothetical protein [Paracoccus aminovorans]|uniref:hypothetical protein n=1 Tax=Paracoccus aminovorans TaxID=34004 RepID=UPI0011143151|nr:hypothetical protein [Paracoccus aminovorans]
MPFYLTRCCAMAPSTTYTQRNAATEVWLAFVHDENAAALTPADAVRGGIKAKRALDAAVAADTGLRWRLNENTITVIKPSAEQRPRLSPIVSWWARSVSTQAA